VQLFKECASYRKLATEMNPAGLVTFSAEYCGLRYPPFVIYTTKVRILQSSFLVALCKEILVECCNITLTLWCKTVVGKSLTVGRTRHCVKKQLPQEADSHKQNIIMKNGVFWVVTPYGSCKNRRIGGTWRPLHQGDKNR
jgi:hypothetical protein